MKAEWTVNGNYLYTSGTISYRWLLLSPRVAVIKTVHESCLSKIQTQVSQVFFKQSKTLLKLIQRVFKSIIEMNLENRKLSLSRLGYYHLSGRRLGSGSFAKVYEGIHRIANEKVAIKTMNITQMTDSYMRKHFKREAELLSRLNHPSIVALFELIETKNHYCIVLEFGGVNLCDYIQTQKRGRLDESSARIMARQLVSAISHMHESNVVHRDIKLENILVNSISKRVKLTDFGLSRSWDRKTMMMTNCGSPEYAAPELHLCLSYGFEVDVWALYVSLNLQLVLKLDRLLFSGASFSSFWSWAACLLEWRRESPLVANNAVSCLLKKLNVDLRQ